MLENRRIYEISHNQIVTAGSLFYEAQLENDASELARIKKTDKKLTKSTELSLKRIYQLQNQFFREAKVEERVIGLKELLKSLETENLLLDKYLRSNKKYSFDENAFLEVIYENIEQMFAELQIPMQEINEEKEAALYFEIQNLLTKIESKITAHLWYSKDNISKRYFLEVSEPGRYELFIKKPTSNGFSDVKVDTNEIKVKNNNITYPVNIITSKTSQWAKLSEIDLIQGTNKIEVNEPIARSYLGENGNYELSFGPNRNCNELPLPYLDRNTYILNLKAHSDFNLEDLYVFSDMKGTNFPLLPYRGTKFNLEGEKTSYLLIHKLVLIPGDYTLKLCRLTHEEIKPQNIKLSSMYIERISVPVIALFKKNTDTLDPPTTLNVSSKDINNTQYEVSISGSGSSLLMFDQRYDAGWNFSANDIVSDHQRLHGYANGWKVNKKSNGETHLTLTFAGQKLLVIGWFVSLISLIGCIGLLFYYFLKKNDFS